jgi:hypothetical protein
MAVFGQLGNYVTTESFRINPLGSIGTYGENAMDVLLNEGNNENE